MYRVIFAKVRRKLKKSGENASIEIGYKTSKIMKVKFV